jgi:uncharacterized protein YfaA (DUF2138 family)
VSTAADAPDRISSHVWRISLVVIVGAIMSILDTTIVNVALETLSRDLHLAAVRSSGCATRSTPASSRARRGL